MSNMTLKDKIKNGLSYTSLTYEEMLQDMLGLFIGENAITTRWNNLSETDIITIYSQCWMYIYCIARLCK